jgi:chromosome partitioning protein
MSTSPETSVCCGVCARPFAPELAYQVAVVGGQRRYFCSLDCRKAGLGDTAFAQRRARRVAILNQKGGTGKTTTAVNLAAGIADRGYDTLLVDVDAQGNVGTSLGVRGERTLYHLLVDGATKPDDVVIPVRGHLDVITADATLALAEVHLARLDHGRDRLLAEKMAPLRSRYQYVVLDCGPSLSLLNQNALSYVDEVLIPVSCDYLALVGVKQVLRTLKDVDRHLGHAVRISGVVPTFFDARTKLSREAVEALAGHFKERLYEPIRRSSRLAEAPSHRQTIFEYAPESPGADDYRKLVARYVANAAPRPGETVRPEAA